ncbi:hypothetical protein UM93_12630 [Psychromicrobium lacuslunae]|uniref:Acyltransferase 3 domain-containing protein n=1 Tax=Psychromicrobium lacuslunae TaxID=1618207 RepID=A0A0D4C172_9MICC|nr:hypothetical protein UM93_12630 [Psychromicrobium lacuslunae]
MPRARHDAVPARRIFALDGLRGLAVTAVVAFHLFPQQIPGGYLGVDLFFVLSGYFITGSLLNRRASGKPVLKVFWLKRARRILPPLLLMLPVALLLAALVGGAAGSRLLPQSLSALSFSSNWWYAISGQGYFDTAEPPLLQHLWSLGVEEQFYLLWPILFIALAALPRRRWRVLLTASMGLLSAGLLTFFALNGHSDRGYFGSDSHSFGLFFGAAAAFLGQWLNPRLAPWLRSSAVLILLLPLGYLLISLSERSWWAFRGGIPLVTLISALLIVLLSTDRGLGARLLSISPLHWLAQRSYGIYLWHWPLTVLCHQLIGSSVPWATASVVIPLTLLASSLSWKYLEQPLIASGYRTAWRRCQEVWRQRPERRWQLISGLTAIGMIGSLASVATLLSPQQTELQASISQGQQAIAQQSQLPAAPPSSQPATPPSGKPPAPASSKPRPVSGTEILAIGDSVMLASAPQLLSGFPGIDINAQVGRQMWDLPALLQQLKQSKALRPVLLVGLGSNGDFSPTVLEDAQRILGPERRLVLITPSGPRDWIPQARDKIKDFGLAHPAVKIARWDEVRAQVTDFASDGIHPGQQGATIYVSCIQAALRQN